MEKKQKVAKIMAVLKGVEFISSIPIHLWVTDKKEVESNLKSMLWLTEIK